VPSHTVPGRARRTGGLNVGTKLFSNSWGDELLAGHESRQRIVLHHDTGIETLALTGLLEVHSSALNAVADYEATKNGTGELHMLETQDH